MNGIRIAGTGTYLPGPALDQDAVRAFLRRTRDCFSDAEQDRLLQQTGILKRHYAIDPADDSRRETNTTMATRAGERALATAGWKPDDVDLLIVTTIVPDQLMPPTSTMVQEALGIAHCTELGISANCTAPTKGLWVAASQLRLGAHRRALVCSSQLASFGFNPPWANPARMTPSQAHLRWVLSDGASALALEIGEPDIDLRIRLDSEGVGKRSGMSLDLGVASPDFRASYDKGSHHVTQDPRYALKEGIRLATAGLERMLKTFECAGESIDHFIPSVSSRLVEDLLRQRFARFGIRPEVWRTNYASVGYVGSVAVGIMLDELARDGTLRPGDVICTVAEESSKWMFAGSIFRWNP